MLKDSNDECVATRIGDSWFIKRHVPLKLHTGAVVLGIIPLGLELGILGAVAFWLVSYPPFGWTPTFKGLGWPAIAGWIAAILAVFFYLGLHTSRLIGLILTAFWTVAWAWLFSRYGWGYGLAAGAMALIGHLGIIFGLLHESGGSPRNPP